jgi:hypothetical protein
VRHGFVGGQDAFGGTISGNGGIGGFGGSHESVQTVLHGTLPACGAGTANSSG